MSLYYEAVAFISTDAQQGSLKSRVFAAKDLKSKPKQIFALVSETTKWSPILKEIIEKSSILQHERKLTPQLSLLLVHDLLLAKGGIAATPKHVLRAAVERHKARLGAEFTKARVRRGCADVEALRARVESHHGETEVKADESGSNETNSGAKRWPHPRWVRINCLKTTLLEQLLTTFVDYRKTESLSEILSPRVNVSGDKVLYVDHHIPDLLALPTTTPVSLFKSQIESGTLILQDKASCFPAYLLDPQPSDHLIIDACAAPGNKTTHLASLLHARGCKVQEMKIIACERDPARGKVLTGMVDAAGASGMVSVHATQTGKKVVDFLKIDPSREPWCDASAILLDPSCSGSGIVGRDDASPVKLPALPGNEKLEQKAGSRKRKRKVPAPATTRELKRAPAEEVEEIVPPSQDLADRLANLSAFQTRIVEHAMSFPKAKRITYSTCSMYSEENEDVVQAVLSSDVARRKRWRLLRREEQVEGMRTWELRGKNKGADVSLLDSQVAEAVIRCEKHTEEGTQGFFVAAFLRDDDEAEAERNEEDKSEEVEDEWSGIED